MPLFHQFLLGSLPPFLTAPIPDASSYANTNRNGVEGGGRPCALIRRVSYLSRLPRCCCCCGRGRLEGSSVRLGLDEAMWIASSFSALHRCAVDSSLFAQRYPCPWRIPFYAAIGVWKRPEQSDCQAKSCRFAGWHTVMPHRWKGVCPPSPACTRRWL